VCYYLTASCFKLFCSSLCKLSSFRYCTKTSVGYACPKYT